MSENLLQDTLYVILDTNVLLSHLKVISELKDFPIEGKYAFIHNVHVNALINNLHLKTISLPNS